MTAALEVISFAFLAEERRRATTSLGRYGNEAGPIGFHLFQVLNGRIKQLK